MIKKTTGLILMAAMLLLAGPAQADIIEQTHNFGPTLPNFNQDLLFNKYSGSIGDLTSIIIDLSLTSIGGLGQADNESGSPANITMEFGAEGYLFSSDVSLPSNLSNQFGQLQSFTSANFNLSADDGDGVGVQTGGSDYSELEGGTITQTAQGSVLGASFGQYVGAGTFTIKSVVSTYLDITGAGGISQGSSPPTASGFVKVSYNYNAPAGAVPEPGTMLLLASGLGSLGLWRYRRRRNS